MSALTRRAAIAQVGLRANETESTRRAHAGIEENELTRALRSNGLWLTVAYLGLLFLLTRAYL